MAADRNTLFARLAALGIASTTVEHELVFTVGQSGALRQSLPGAHTKNLFLTAKDGCLVLVVAKDDTRVDLKALANRLGAGRFSFGKVALLEAVLGVPARLGHAAGADRLRRGQLPSSGEHRHHSACHAGPHPLHRSLRPRAPDPPSWLSRLTLSPPVAKWGGTAHLPGQRGGALSALALCRRVPPGGQGA